MNKRLHTATIGNRLYRVIQRKNGTVQVWIDFPAGESAGYPECFYSGDLAGAREWWKKFVVKK